MNEKPTYKTKQKITLCNVYACKSPEDSFNATFANRNVSFFKNVSVILMVVDVFVSRLYNKEQSSAIKSQ